MMSRVQRFAVPLTLEVATLPNVISLTHSLTHADNPVSYYGIFAENRKCAFGATTRPRPEPVADGPGPVEPPTTVWTFLYLDKHIF